MLRLAPALIALLLTGGCVPMASAPPVRTAVPEPASGPAGPGCAAQIARFREILVYDRSVNRVAQSVFDKAMMGVEQAEAACSAGRGGEAMAALGRTKRASGYY